MNIIDIIKTANHNLFKSKVRTILTILAIFIGSFTIILNTAINSGVNSFIDKQVESIGGDGYIEIMSAGLADQVSSSSPTSGSEIKEYDPNQDSSGTVYITAEDIDKIRTVDGINQVYPYSSLTVEYITSEKTDKKYSISTTILPSNSLNVDTTAGRTPNADTTAPEILLPAGYAEKLGFSSDQAAVGQPIKLGLRQTAKCYTVTDPNDCLTTVDATISGTAASGVFVNRGSANINPALSDQITVLMNEGVPEATTNRYAAATADVDPAKIDQIKTTLKDLGFNALTIDDEVGLFRTLFDAILVVFNIFGAIALLAAAIGIINTLFMSVKERTREIGLMKALGMSNAKIFLSFSFEAILLGFWGSVIGIIFSMLIGYAGNEIAHSSFLADFPTFTLVEFRPLDMLTIVFIIMLIAFLAGTLPARRAAKQNPIDALRYE